jgi:hypothetical protein
LEKKIKYNKKNIEINSLEKLYMKFSKQLKFFD